MFTHLSLPLSTRNISFLLATCSVISSTWSEPSPWTTSLWSQRRNKRRKHILFWNQLLIISTACIFVENVDVLIHFDLPQKNVSTWLLFSVHGVTWYWQNILAYENPIKGCLWKSIISSICGEIFHMLYLLCKYEQNKAKWNGNSISLIHPSMHRNFL